MLRQHEHVVEVVEHSILVRVSWHGLWYAGYPTVMRHTVFMAWFMVCWLSNGYAPYGIYSKKSNGIASQFEFYPPKNLNYNY